jgi:hypothetical protein
MSTANTIIKVTTLGWTLTLDLSAAARADHDAWWGAESRDVDAALGQLGFGQWPVRVASPLGVVDERVFELATGLTEAVVDDAITNALESALYAVAKKLFDAEPMATWTPERGRLVALAHSERPLAVAARASIATKTHFVTETRDIWAYAPVERRSNVRCSECDHIANRECLSLREGWVPFCIKCGPGVRQAKTRPIDAAALAAKVKAGCDRVAAQYAAQGVSDAAIFSGVVKARAGALEAEAERTRKGAA